MKALTALAEPTRLRIVEILAECGRMPASAIGREFTISAPAISQHLKVLKEARLVTVEVRAQQRIYALNDTGLGEIETWVADIRRTWEERFSALDALLEKKKQALKNQSISHEKE